MSDQLAVILGCKPDEIFVGEVLKEIEDEFLNDPIRELGVTYHAKKPNSAYLKIEGWFTKSEVERLVPFISEGFIDEK